MAVERYRLFFRHLELGEIVREVSDFPASCGRYTPAAHSNEDRTQTVQFEGELLPAETPSAALWHRLQKFIAFSMASDALLQAGFWWKATSNFLSLYPRSAATAVSGGVGTSDRLKR